MSGKLITGSRDWDYYSAYYSWVELGWLERNKFPYYKKNEYNVSGQWGSFLAGLESYVGMYWENGYLRVAVGEP